MRTKHFVLVFLCALMYTAANGQNIGLNLQSPTHPVHIQQPEGMELMSLDPVLYVTYTGQGNEDVIGIRGLSKPANFYGIGGYFEGGWIGVRARVEGEGPETNRNYLGVSSLSFGTGAGSFYGIYSAAQGAGTNYGIYGAAVNGTTNWAGYFDQGNVYIKNRLGVGQLNPQYPVHINQPFGTQLGVGDGVLYVEYTGTNEDEVIAIRARSATVDHGVGGHFEGGRVGLRGTVNGLGGSNFGSYQGCACSSSADNSGIKYGMLGYASGQGGTKVAVYGDTDGTGTNWAGYFDDGNVFIKNKLGIGQSTPLYPVHVNQPSGTTLSSGQPVLHVEYTGTNNQDVVGVRGKSAPLDFYGLGGDFEGGWIGARGKVIATGASTYTGLNGEASGGTGIKYGVHGIASGDGIKYGVRGSASGPTGTKYGVYGSATGSDGINWAGYFDGGDVYIDNKLGIARTPATNALEVEGNASKSSAGDWIANSDARLKKNIQPLDSRDMLEKLLSLQGITYEWDDDKTGSYRPDGIQYGFTAQDIEETFPMLVEEDALGYLQTAYGTYDAMMVEALRALNDKVIALESENQLLHLLITRMANVEEENKALRTDLEKIKVSIGQEAIAQKMRE